MGNSNSHKITIPIIGMTCAACAQTIQGSLLKLDGIKDGSVNYATNNATIEYDEDKVSLSQIKAAIVSVGYDAIIDTQTGEIEKEVHVHELRFRRSLLTDLVVAGIFSIPLFIISMFFMHMPYANMIMAVLATPVVFFSGRRFFISAIKKIQTFSFSMDTLVAISTFVSYCFSLLQILFPSMFAEVTKDHHVYFESSAIVIFFVLLGKYLEDLAKSNSSKAIQALVESQPTTASFIDDSGNISIIPIHQILPQQKILVKPGEKIAVDGMVISGESRIDESSITGESYPQSKTVGATVYSGTMNLSGSLTIKALHTGAETVLSRMIEKVREAQNSKPPIQHVADKISSWFVPVILLIGLITWILWWFIHPENGFYLGLYNFVSVMVIACPCALGLATPTAIMVGISSAAKKGILIKDAVSLEKAKSITALVVDKTGTLTIGKPAVVASKWNRDDAEMTFAPILHAIEVRSEHPYAKAIVYHCQSFSSKKILIGAFQNNKGNGVTAMFNRVNYSVGKLQWEIYKTLFFTEELKTFIADHHQPGITIIIFANDQEAIAAFALTDQLNPHAKEVMQVIKQRGIKTHLLTGDNEASASLVAESCDIDAYQSEVLPSEKANYVKDLQLTGETVAMVGDGVNDAEAIAVADVSFAMGKGTDVAMDVAQVTLMRNDLQLIPTTILISKKTMQTMYQNLFWAFIYNLICIPIAAGALYPLNGFLLNPMIAGGAMALSSISVVGNSLWLKKKINA